MNKSNFLKIFLLAFFLFIGLAEAQTFNPASASVNNTIDAIPQAFLTKAHAWEGVLQGFAMRLFWVLATIQFVWAAIRLVLERGDLDDWLGMMVQQVLFIGFFYTLLMHSSEWATAIVNSFRQAADEATASAGGIQGVSPSDFFDTGIRIVSEVWKKFSAFEFVDGLQLFLCAMIILVSLALIGAFLIAALVESYLVISAGVLFMGFGGSSFTQDYAIRVINYAVSVGAKLFVLQLLVGLGQSLFQDMEAQLAASDYSLQLLLVMVGVSIVFLTLSKTIPDLVQSLINGASFSSGWAIMSAANAIGSAVTTAVATTAGGVTGAVGSTMLAREQVLAEGQQPFSKDSIGQTAGKAFSNFGMSAIHDLGGRMGGRKVGGTMGSRVAYNTFREANDLRAQRKKPSLPDETVNAIRPE